MDKIPQNHYKLNIILLSCIGLWPYKNATFRRITNLVCTCFLAFHIIPEIMMVVTAKYTYQMILFNMSPMFMGLASFYKYCTFWYQIEAVKVITELINHDWQTITDDKELKIIETHTSFGKRFTKIFALWIYPSAGALIMSQFTSTILDILVPLNETRPHQLPILFECFVDKQKYFYVIAFYFDIIVILVCTIFVSTESALIMWLQHGCALYAIVSHRIKHAFDDSCSRACSTDLGKNTSANDTVVRVANMHRRAIEFSVYLKTSFMPAYFILLLIGIICLSINLLRVSQLIRHFSEIKELLISVLFVFSVLGYMFYMNYIIQQSIDRCINIFEESYHSNWYEAPLSAQKLMLFIMLRSTKIFPFEMFGMFNPSINGFSQLVRISINYFTALIACQ